jgi:hypothetical protein
LLLILQHTATNPQQLNQQQSFTVDPATQCHTTQQLNQHKSFTVDPATHRHTPPQQLNQRQSFTVDPAAHRHTTRTAESTAIFYC